MGVHGAIWIALAIVFAYVWRRPWLIPLIVTADVAADGTAALLRALIGRPRPPLTFREITTLVSLPNDPSFPSGHAATSFACALCLAWASRRVLVRSALLGLALAIAISRLYVGVHYPLDVAGGALLGVIVAAVLLACLRAAARRRGLDLFARFQQPGRDDPERRDECDPQPDRATVGR